MNWMKRTVWISCLVVAVAAAGSTTTDGSQRSTPEIMQQKLIKSQQLLRALILADFDTIKELSDELDSLSEYQSWFVLPTPEYAQYTREFRQEAQAMALAGANRDLGTAYGAYTSMLGTCLQCHNYMR